MVAEVVQEAVVQLVVKIKAEWYMMMEQVCGVRVISRGAQELLANIFTLMPVVTCSKLFWIA